MKETRFAILVGMNNYKENPLSYSVKDVIDLKNVLIERCNFQAENVVVIQDSSTPVLTQINEAYLKIARDFRTAEDMLVFYYSGHGEYDEEEEKSVLLFEDDTTIAIGDVLLNYFEPLKAKNQYLIVDACHSGKNIYIKSKGNKQKRERKLLYDSRELFFLFAAEENKKAYQTESLKNSYYTYYLIEAIKNDRLYDEDGFLTMTSIDEYVRKKISSHSDVIQIPGSESRTTGYKPFAFNQPNTPVAEPVKPLKTHDMSEPNSNFDLGQSLSSENRNTIQEQLKVVLYNSVKDFSLDDLKEKYEINIKPGDASIPYELRNELEKNIITKAQRENISAVNDTFVKTSTMPNRRKTGLSSVFDMLHGEPEPGYSYDIKYNDHFITAAFIQLKAKTYQCASGGFFCLFYQAKYGFVFCRAFFKYDWDGSGEKVDSFVRVNLTPYRLVEANIETAKAELLDSLQQLVAYIATWNIEREKEINEFMKKAK
jgi:hypothetical protein